MLLAVRLKWAIVDGIGNNPGLVDRLNLSVISGSSNQSQARFPDCCDRISRLPAEHRLQPALAAGGDTAGGAMRFDPSCCPAAATGKSSSTAAAVTSLNFRRRNGLSIARYEMATCTLAVDLGQVRIPRGGIASLTRMMIAIMSASSSDSRVRAFQKLIYKLHQVALMLAIAPWRPVLPSDLR